MHVVYLLWLQISVLEVYGSLRRLRCLIYVSLTLTLRRILHRDVASILSESAEEEKKRKYSDAAEARRASFTPLVVSVDGVLGREAECFIQLLAEKCGKKHILKLQDGCEPGCPLPF